MSIYNLLNTGLEDNLVADELTDDVVNETLDVEESADAEIAEMEEAENEIAEDETKIEILEATEDELEGIADSLESILKRGRGLDRQSHVFLRNHLNAIEMRLGIEIYTPSNESFEFTGSGIQATEDSLESIREVISKVSDKVKSIRDDVLKKMGSWVEYMVSANIRLLSKLEGQRQRLDTTPDLKGDVVNQVSVSGLRYLSFDDGIDPTGNLGRALDYLDDQVSRLSNWDAEFKKRPVKVFDNLAKLVFKEPKERVESLKELTKQYLSKHGDEEYKLLTGFHESISSPSPYEKGRDGFLYGTELLPGNDVLAVGYHTETKDIHVIYTKGKMPESTEPMAKVESVNVLKGDLDKAIKVMKQYVHLSGVTKAMVQNRTAGMSKVWEDYEKFINGLDKEDPKYDEKVEVAHTEAERLTYTWFSIIDITRNKTNNSISVVRDYTKYADKSLKALGYK